jgi:hypothetical protein
MNKMLTVFAALGLTTAVAWADDAPTPDATEVKDDEVVDCETLEGEAKTECEAGKAAAAAADAPKKGGKSLQKSEDNRMESVNDE